MNKKLRCSVVMTVYNAEKYLRDTIESVLNQTMEDFELIIVDDCSTDSSAEIVKEFLEDKRVKYFKNDENLKVSKTRNFGVSVAKADRVAFIDSDDVWLNTKLEKQLAHMDKTGARICYSGYYFISDEGNLQNKVFHVPEKVNFKKLLKQNVITPSASIFDRDLLVKYPFYADEVHEDFVAFLQMLKNDVDFAYGIDEPLILYRLTTGSKSRNKFKAMKMTMKTYKEVGLNFFARLFNLPFYILNGLKKYKGLKDADDTNAKESND